MVIDEPCVLVVFLSQFDLICLDKTSAFDTVTIILTLSWVRVVEGPVLLEDPLEGLLVGRWQGS